MRSKVILPPDLTYNQGIDAEIEVEGGKFGTFKNV